MFHADADFSVAVKSSIEAHNVRGVTLMQHLQLPDDLVPDGWFDLQVDQLEHRRPQGFILAWWYSNPFGTPTHTGTSYTVLYTYVMIKM